MQSPGRGCPARRGGHSGKKPLDRGTEPEPQSNGRGYYPLQVTFSPSVVNSWQTGSVLSLRSYVRSPEDRLCEPQSPRLDHQRKHPVRGPPWAGLRDFRLGMSPGRSENFRGLKSHPGRTDFPEFLPIWGRTFPYHGSVAGGQLRQTGSGDETVQPVPPRQPSSAGVSRTGLDSGSGGFPNNRG